MSIYDHKDDSSYFFKEITNRFVAYAQKEINTAALKTFISGSISLEAKDQFDTLVKDSINLLVNINLVEYYSIDSLYIQGSEKIVLDMIIKLPNFNTNAIAVKFIVKDGAETDFNYNDI